jgi:hypothetical protein
MASRDFEQEYDPRLWSSRFSDPQELLESHVEFGNRGRYINKLVQKTYLLLI